MKKADIQTTNYETIIAIGGISKKGRAWLRAHVPDSRNCCDMVNAEHRYAIDIMEGALAAGLMIQDSTTGRKAVR